MSEAAAVYRFFDAEGVLLYVGAAKNPEKRWKIHARQRRWWPSVATKTVEWHPNLDDAYAAESAAIAAEKPQYNIMVPGPDGGRPVMRRDAPGEAWIGGRPHWESPYHQRRRQRSETKPHRGATPRPLGDYVGSAEIRRMFGVSRQRVQQLAGKPDFPEPYDVLAAGKVWKRADIEAWAKAHDRTPGN